MTVEVVLIGKSANGHDILWFVYLCVSTYDMIACSLYTT